MKLYHVVAVARNGVIGKDNKLPWHFKTDLQYFKRLTTGSTVIMGRKTFESIGRALPGRKNFVLSRSPRPPAGTVQFFTSLVEALAQVTTPAAFVIGGAELFQETLPLIDGVYLTRIDAEYEGDTHYPELPKGFKEITREPLQDKPLLEAIFYENLNVKK